MTQFWKQLVCCLIFAACFGCTEKPETLVTSSYDEQAMESAIQQAVGEVDDFIAELESGDSESYAVKVPIEDEGQTEHFWLTDVTFRDGSFHGQIGNDPGIVSNVVIGQEWSVGKTEISDWMYMRDGKMYGNYTLRPLLATMPEDEAAQLRAILASP